MVKGKIKRARERGCFWSLEDNHVLYMVLYTLTSLPMMPRPGTQALVVSSADKIYISALFASSLVRNNICFEDRGFGSFMKPWQGRRECWYFLPPWKPDMPTIASIYIHISPILNNLHWLPVEKRITYKVLLIVFKCLNGLSPQYLSEPLIEYKPTRTLRSCSKKLLVVPRVNTKRYGERAFSVIGPRLWNSLPQNLRDITNLEHFKKNLKTYLFKL